MAKAAPKTTTKPRAKGECLARSQEQIVTVEAGADNQACAKLLDLETLICDLDLMVDVLRAVSEDNLIMRGNVLLTEAEADRMYFVLCHVCEYSKRLKKFYYSDAAA